MNIKNDIKIAFTFIGTFIGAGFASGQEILLFFSDSSIISPILSGVFCGLLAFLFCESGRIFKGNLISYVFPKHSKKWQAVIKACNFCIFSAMIAGAEYCLNTTLGIVGGGIISGALMLIVNLFGNKGIKIVNTVVIPMIFAIIVYLFINAPSDDVYGRISFGNSIIYASMNILSSGLILTDLCKKNSKKDNFLIATLSSIILTISLTLVYLLVKTRKNYDMPILEICKTLKVGKLGGILIFLAVFTTGVGSCKIMSDNSIIKSLGLLAGAYIVSCIGFSNLVSFSYPIIGIIGIVLSASALYCLVKENKTRQDSHSLLINNN